MFNNTIVPLHYKTRHLEGTMKESPGAWRMLDGLRPGSHPNMRSLFAKFHCPIMWIKSIWMTLQKAF